MHNRTGLPGLTFRPLRLCDGGSDQLPNAGCVQIRRLCYPHVANPLAVAAEQAIGIGQMRAEVKADVNPIGMSSGEDEGVAGPLRKCEVVGDRIHLVDELAGLRSFCENQFSRGQS